MWNHWQLDSTRGNRHETEIMESFVTQQATAGHTLQILEAGCGRRWGLNLGSIPYELTGVDLDRTALDIRKNKLNDLHHTIEGDLRDVNLPDGHFDVIFNSFVLEHVEGAETVLNNFVRWLKPGGIMVIMIPDPRSVHGFVTRVTPHWFHVFYYRQVLGLKNAGQPGYAPYPVHYDPVVSLTGMRAFCRKNHLSLLAEYAAGTNRPGKGAVRALVHIFKLAASVLSIGALAANHSGLLFVIRKPMSSSANFEPQSAY